MAKKACPTLQLRLGLGVWVGWGGVITFMLLAYMWCYAAATSWLGVWGVGWGSDVHVPCVHTWCYAAATSWLRVWVGGVGWVCKSILVTDGPPCYPKLASEAEACNHSKGIFCTKKRKTWGTLLVHTSGIDGMWKTSKGAVSASWGTRKNPQLLQGIWIWQWRWHHGNCKGFMSLTGH